MARAMDASEPRGGADAPASTYPAKNNSMKAKYYDFMVNKLLHG